MKSIENILSALGLATESNTIVLGLTAVQDPITLDLTAEPNLMALDLATQPDPIVLSLTGGIMKFMKFFDPTEMIHFI